MTFLRESACDECGRLVAYAGGLEPYPIVAEKGPFCGIRDEVAVGWMGFEFDDEAEKVFPLVWPPLDGGIPVGFVATADVVLL